MKQTDFFHHWHFQIKEHFVSVGKSGIVFVAQHVYWGKLRLG